MPFLCCSKRTQCYECYSENTLASDNVENVSINFLETPPDTPEICSYNQFGTPVVQEKQTRFDLDKIQVP